MAENIVNDDNLREPTHDEIVTIFMAITAAAQKADLSPATTMRIVVKMPAMLLCWAMEEGLTLQEEIKAARGLIDILAEETASMAAAHISHKHYPGEKDEHRLN